MSFSYKPFTEEEIAKLQGLIEAGVYDFVVVGARAKRSKSGNSMIELDLEIKDNDNNWRSVKDYLVATPNMAWKLKHFCDAVGLEDEYKDNTFNENLCISKRGKVEIFIQDGKEKEGGGFYPDKNAVKDYILGPQGPLKFDSATKDEFINDPIPF